MTTPLPPTSPTDQRRPPGPLAGAPLGFLDSGTSRTRLRLWDGQDTVWQGEQRVGASDVARAGHPQPLLDALRTLLKQVPAGAVLTHLVCSGMITSNLGLLEVPHVTGPAGVSEVACGVRHLEVPGFPPIVMIPGIVTRPSGPGGWHSADVLRGEEVEVFGLCELLDTAGPTDFLHLGSHHKLVQVDASRRVTRSVTSLAGEALQAISRGTILASSVPDLSEDTPLDPAAWREGLHAAATLGVGRALFLVRLGQQLGQLSREAAGAFLHGVMAQLTLDVLRTSDPACPLVIYGHDAQAVMLLRHLASVTPRPLQHCGAATVDQATVSGSLAVLRAARGAGAA